MGEHGVRIFYTICNKIWLSGKWPSEWAHTVFTPLHKLGSTKKCDNFRLIFLITHASKIMLHIINERLKAYLSKEIAPEQAGFVKGKGNREQILIIRQVIEKAREFNSQYTYALLISPKRSIRWNGQGCGKHYWTWAHHNTLCTCSGDSTRGAASVQTEGPLLEYFSPKCGCTARI